MYKVRDVAEPPCLLLTLTTEDRTRVSLHYLLPDEDVPFTLIPNIRGGYFHDVTLRNLLLDRSKFWAFRMLSAFSHNSTPDAQK